MIIKVYILFYIEIVFFFFDNDIELRVLDHNLKRALLTSLLR